MTKLRPYLYRPRLSRRFLPVWQRNFLVWQKLAVPSVLGNLADPLFYMLALGVGLGRLLPEVDGMSYMAFLAAGTVCYSTMNSATFESLYSAFSRMHVQKTWHAILNTPLDVDDVFLGEAIWAVSKSMLTGVAIFAVIWLLDISRAPQTLWLVPLAALIGFCFTGMALVMTAVSKSYDFFMYYFTLVVTPMVLLSGVFFPLSQMPEILQGLARVLPLSHAIDLARPLLLGRLPAGIVGHMAVILAYGIAGYYTALVLVRRRIMA